MARNEYLAPRLFHGHTAPMRGYEALVEPRYSPQHVNVLMSEEERKRHFGDGAATTELGHKAFEGAGVGGGLGAIAGGALAAIAVAATVAVPGFGSLVAGPIVAALAGAGAGAVAGGAIGALVGAGTAKSAHKDYDSGLKDGGIVMVVTPPNTGGSRVFRQRVGR